MMLKFGLGIKLICLIVLLLVNNKIISSILILFIGK